ncbi:MAG: hypothetical protein ACRCZE_00445 [Candidatus Altimarinota bacterium]
MNLHNFKPELIPLTARLVFEKSPEGPRSVSSTDKNKPDSAKSVDEAGKSSPDKTEADKNSPEKSKKEAPKKVSSIDIRNAARARARELAKTNPEVAKALKEMEEYEGIAKSEVEKDPAKAAQAAGELMAILQEANPEDKNLAYWYQEANNDANAKLGVERMKGVNKAKVAAQKSKEAVIKILKDAGFDASIPATNAGQKAWVAAEGFYETDHVQAKANYETAKTEFDKFGEQLKLTIAAKEKAEKALTAVPDSINVYMPNGNSGGAETIGAAHSFEFTAKTREDSALIAEYKEAKTLVASDPAKALEKYQEAEKKFIAALAQVNRLTNLATDINNYYKHQEEATGNGKSGQREIQLVYLQIASSKVYAAARDFAFDADPTAIDKIFVKSADNGNYDFSANFNRIRTSFYGPDYQHKKPDDKKVVFKTTPGEESEAIIPEPPKQEPVEEPKENKPETPQPAPVTDSKKTPPNWVQDAPIPAPLDLPEVPEFKLKMPPLKLPSNWQQTPSVPATGDNLEDIVDEPADKASDKPQASIPTKKTDRPI